MTGSVIVSVNYGNHSLAVRGEFVPFMPGRFDGAWEDCYPDDGGVFEVQNAITAKGRDIWPRLPDAIREQIGDLAYEAAEEEATAFCCDQADFEWDVPQ